MLMKTSLRHTILPVGLLAALATAGIGGSAQASDWELDPAHTTATFSVRHLVVSTVEGRFEKVSGNVALDEANPARSSVDIAIDASSINTGNSQRDGHLKSPDFFDVAKFPKLEFKAKKIDKAGAGKFKVEGDLTMHGVTRPVTLDVEGPSAAIKDPMGRMVRAVAARGKLNRKDWGLTWNKALEGGGVLVSDEVKLEIHAELVEAAGKGAAKAEAREQALPKTRNP